MKKIYGLIIALFIVSGSFAQNIPEKPKQERLVNDFARVLSDSEEQKLETKLVQFAGKTSTQILIVTVESLNGYEASDFAFQLGENWGLGQKEKNNGVIVLFKPKTASERGQVFVAVGYGLEGVIPDAIANREIVQYEMIPRFKQGDIFGGLYAGTEVIMRLAAGEFTAEEYQQKAGSSGRFPFEFLLFLIFFIVIPVFRSRKRRYYSAGRNSSLPFWLIMGGMMGSGNRGGSWSNFSNGSGGFGGGNSFGGFGGGSFGGGGAGGSW